MMQFLAIGIGAGAAAALLFASVTSGAWFSIPLFYLAPLPIMIAGLGWSHWAALIASLTGAVALAAIFGLVFLFGFLAGAGVPAWWLGYLAMLARPVAATNGQSGPQLEWYPPGRLVIWATLLAALVVLVSVPHFGMDVESFRAGLRKALETILRPEIGSVGDAPLPSPGRTDRLLDFLVTAIPPAAAVLATITNLLNLWLAGRVVKFSGRLARPWPQLSAMTFPGWLAAVLALTVILSVVDGLIGIVAGIVSATLLLAFGLLGFAVLHSITQGLQVRSLILGLAYAAVLLLGWPMLALCLLGLADTAIDFRGRAARKRGPPAVS